MEIEPPKVELPPLDEECQRFLADNRLYGLGTAWDERPVHACRERQLLAARTELAELRKQAKDYRQALHTSNETIGVLLDRAQKAETESTKLHAEVDELKGKLYAARADQERLETALHEISAREFANSGYNLPQMIRMMSQVLPELRTELKDTKKALENLANKHSSWTTETIAQIVDAEMDAARKEREEV